MVQRHYDPPVSAVEAELRLADATADQPQAVRWCVTATGTEPHFPGSNR